MSFPIIARISLLFTKIQIYSGGLIALFLAEINVLILQDNKNISTKEEKAGKKGRKEEGKII